MWTRFYAAAIAIGIALTTMAITQAGVGPGGGGSKEYQDSQAARDDSGDTWWDRALRTCCYRSWGDDGGLAYPNPRDLPQNNPNNADFRGDR